MESLRTALVVEIGDAEPAVATYRVQLDSFASLGVPAHVTVLFPFARPSQIDDGVLATLGALSAGFAAFSFELAEVSWFGDEVIWLGPDERGVVGFRELTEIVCEAFPSYPRYGGAYDEVVPHLTVGAHCDVAQMRAAAEALRPQLPIAARADALTLLVEGSDRHWTVATRMPFSQRP
jgi:2'-5' RNA ligase superfamily